MAGAVPGFEGGLLAVTDEDNGDAYANYKLFAVADLATALGLPARQAAPEPRRSAVRDHGRAGGGNRAGVDLGRCRGRPGDLGAPDGPGS